jgi:hypothetical protein
MMCREVDTTHGVAVDELMIGRDSRAMVVAIRVVVAAHRSRQVVFGTQGAIHNEGKRRHDRESGRKASAHRLGETNHRAPE